MKTFAHNGPIPTQRNSDISDRYTLALENANFTHNGPIATHRNSNISDRYAVALENEKATQPVQLLRCATPIFL